MIKVVTFDLVKPKILEESMNKEKKYELIWSLILIIFGIILSIVGCLIFPMVSLIIIIGIFLIIYGVINVIKNFK